MRAASFVDGANAYVSVLTWTGVLCCGEADTRVGRSGCVSVFTATTSASVAGVSS